MPFLKGVNKKRPILSGQSGSSPVALLIISIILIASVIFFYLGFYKEGPERKGQDIETQELAESAAPEPAIVIDSGSGEKGAALLESASVALKSGDFEEGAELLRSYLREYPDSPEVKKAFARTLNTIAINEYRAGNLDRAKRFLREAIDTDNDRIFHENLAQVFVKEGDLEKAAQELEPFSADPGTRSRLKGIYIELGNAFYKQGSNERALEYLEKAGSLDPADRDVQRFIERVRSEARAEKDLSSKEGRHFIVKFDGAENPDAGHTISILLEEAYMKVGADLGYYPQDRVTALLVSRESFRDITRSPSWAGAIYDGKIKLPAGGVTQRTDELEKVLFHEYTHALVHRLSDNRAPAWLNEGIAQIQEGADKRRANERLKQLAMEGRLSLRSFERPFINMGDADARVAYAASLSAASYIADEFGMTAAGRIFENLGKGESLDNAISSAIYFSYDGLEKAWLDSLKR